MTVHLVKLLLVLCCLTADLHARAEAGQFDALTAAGGFRVFVSTSTAVNAVTGTNWEGAGVKPNVPVAADHALERANVLAVETLAARNPVGAEAVETRWILEACAPSTRRAPVRRLLSTVGRTLVLRFT